MVRSLTVIVAALLLVAPARGALAPAEPDPGAWVPDSEVHEIVRQGDSTWLAGSFEWWGPWTGAAAHVTVADGTTAAGFARVAGGNVYAVERDGAGGAYIGGDFHFVDGQPRNGIAHVKADGSLDTAFVADIDSGQVRALALTPDGTKLFAGGSFGFVGTVGAHRLAQLSPVTGAASSFGCVWDTNTSDGGSDTVWALDVSADSATLYVGGNFTGAGTPANCLASSRSGLAAFSVATGSPTAWNPGMNGQVQALAVSGTTVYVGGQFTAIGSNDQPRQNLAMLSTASSGAALWAPDPDGHVYALAVSGSTVYVGGGFSTIGANDLARAGVAAINSAGNASSFFNAGLGAPSIGPPVVFSLSLGGPRLIAGGYFASGDGTANVASLNTTTGAQDPAFSPRPGGAVTAIGAVTPGDVVLGGTFRSVGAVRRPGLVQLDVDGHPTSFVAEGDPQLVRLALSPDGSTAYGSGFLTGGAKYGAWSTATGQRLDWAPAVNLNLFGPIAVSPDGASVYLAGQFSQVNGAPRLNLAAVQASGSGATLPWRPDPDGTVTALATSPDGQVVYAGGNFAHIGADVEARSRLAALSAQTAEATDWDPAPDATVYALTPTADGTHVYVGGAFTHIGASQVPRSRVANVTTATGNATPFAPQVADHEVLAVAPGGDESLVYVAGDFQTLNGTDVHGLGVSEGGLGSSVAWAPVASPYNVNTYARTDGDSVFAGGSVPWIASDARPYYAQFSVAPVSGEAPSLSAAPAAGAPMTCTPGTWRNGARVTVEWLLDGAVAGEGREYTPPADASGRSLACRETAANPAGSATATSSAATVAAAPGAGAGGDGGGGTTPPPEQAAPPVQVAPAGLTLAAKLVRRSRSGVVVRVTISAPATVRAVLAPLPRGRRHRWSRALRAGASTLRLRPRRGRFAAGRHRLTLASPGARSVRLVLRLRR